MRRHHHRAWLGLAAAGLLTIAGCGDDDDDGGNADTTTSDDATTGGPDPSATGASGSEGPPGTDVDTTDGQPGSSDGSDGTDTDTGASVSLLERIFVGIGGQDDLDALTEVEIEVTASRFVTGESPTPGDPASPASDHTGTVRLDLATGSVRNELTRTLTFIPAPTPLEVTEIAAAGEGGWVQGVEAIFGVPPEHDMLSDRYASTLKQARLLNPHVLLKDLSRDPSGASETGSADWEGQTYDTLAIDDAVFPITLWVDPKDDRIVRLTTRENSHLHRDVDLEIRYEDWQDTDAGVLFPNHVQILLGGEVLHDETRSAVTTNPGFDATTFALPPQAVPVLDEEELARGERNHQHNQIFTSIGIPVDGLQLNIAADEPAPGVHFLGGDTHHSVVVEQQDGVILFEAPLYPQRCEAILGWIDENLGGAPVTHVVVSHHHDDHSACARVMVAAGATLVVHEAAEAFFEEVLAAPSTIEPDALEIDPVVNPEIVIVPAGDFLLLDDPVNPIVVYELPSSHAVDMVLPFVQSAGVAYVADIFSPGFAPFGPVGPQEVLAAFAQHGITDDVSLVIGAHGFGYATVADVQTAAGG